jgi:hypothetical protein
MVFFHENESDCETQAFSKQVLVYHSARPFEPLAKNMEINKRLKLRSQFNK